MVCSLVKTAQQFIATGCDNCVALHLERDDEKVKDVTTASFEGLIALNAPDQSWVAKWQHLSMRSYVRGCYAVSVNGTLPSNIKQELRDRRMLYTSRNRQNDPTDFAAQFAAQTRQSASTAAEADEDNDNDEQAQ